MSQSNIPPTNIPQGNYQSNQNYDINVPKMFKDFVTGGNTPNDNEPGENVGIDDIRGQISVSVTNSNTADLIKTLNINPNSTTSSPTPNTTTPVLKVQESRCHAFYRIIGFPVVAADKQLFYNPGLDVIKQQGVTRRITLSDKIVIASNVGSAFETISGSRESFAASTASLFAVPQSVEAGVLALTSGTYGKGGHVNIRKFATPFIRSTDPFDFSIVNQAYSIPGNINAEYSLVGSQEVLLSDYQDGTGLKPKPSLGAYKVLQQHEHIIKPFMVDPRIDFSIWTSESKTFSGLSKRIAVPFVPNAIFLKASSTATAERPLLEKIITDRMSQSDNTANAGQAVSTAAQYVQGIKSIQSINIGNTPISNIFSGNVFKTSQQNAFANYLSIIQAMIWKLVESIGVVYAAQGAYYWLPIPSQVGPEGGCEVRAVPLNQKVSATLLTSNDFDIINNQLQALFSSLTAVSAQANSVPDRGGYAFSSQSLTFDSSTSDSMGDLSTQTMETLTAARTRKLTTAGKALQVIEMIMGEYSGLGLADIIAIVGALYVMPLTSVLGFLDSDAYSRAQSALGGSLPSQDGLITSMNNLASYVNGFYQIMDQVFTDYLGNHARNL